MLMVVLGRERKKIALKGRGCTHQASARCSARPLPITQRADDIPAEAQWALCTAAVFTPEF